MCRHLNRLDRRLYSKFHTAEMENNSAADSVDSKVVAEPQIPASDIGIDARPTDSLNKK